MKKELWNQQEGRRADTEKITKLNENCKRIEEKYDQQTQELLNDLRMMAQLNYQCQSAEKRCEQLETEWECVELDNYQKMETEL